MSAWHPELGPLAQLIGTWRGTGRGEYPTIEAFDYDEEVSFTAGAKPVLAYGQRTWASTDQRPLHVETGYWRPGGGDRVEMLLAHPTGILELGVGTVRSEGQAVIIEVSGRPSLSPTAKQVDEVVRRLVIEDDTLSYTVAMAAVGEPLTHHLAARLTRS